MYVHLRLHSLHPSTSIFTPTCTRGSITSGRNTDLATDRPRHSNYLLPARGFPWGKKQTVDVTGLLHRTSGFRGLLQALCRSCTRTPVMCSNILNYLHDDSYMLTLNYLHDTSYMFKLNYLRDTSCMFFSSSVWTLLSYLHGVNLTFPIIQLVK